ncbi:MAG: hypothetical protein ACJ8CR_24760 [Roseiflexaceae bacterium]
MNAARGIFRAYSEGLGGMAERAALVGGSLTIESAAGAGTRLTAALPLHRQAARG